MFCHVLYLNNRYNTTRAIVIGSSPQQPKSVKHFKLRRTSGKAQDDEERKEHYHFFLRRVAFWYSNKTSSSFCQVVMDPFGPLIVMARMISW
jgi:hypothetical protein